MELQHVGGTFPLTARAQVLALNFSDVDSLGTRLRRCPPHDPRRDG